VDEGSSYLPSDILAALLEAQLARRDEIRALRKKVWDAYYEALTLLAEDGLLTLPAVPDYACPNYHIFYLRTRTPEARNDLLDALKDAGIGATFHYIPLHSSPYGRNTLGCTEDLDITQHCSETLIRLPLYPQLAGRAEEVASMSANIIYQVLHQSVSSLRNVEA